MSSLYLYLYAIVDRTEQDLPELAGLGEAPLRGIAVGDALAVVSGIGAGQVPLSRATLLRHEAVIEALMDGRAVLPARFGTTSDEARLSSALEGHAPALTSALARVRGRVELALRVIDTRPAEAPAGRPRAAEAADGRAYMRALLAVEQREDHRRTASDKLIEQIAAELAPLAEAAVLTRPQRPRLLLKAAYLLPPERVAEMRERIGGLQRAYPELAFLATGPWPPYSFAELEQGPSLLDGAGENPR